MRKGLNRKTKKIIENCKITTEKRLQASVKKKARKKRMGGRKNRRIRNRKTKNILKIVKRLLETRLEKGS